MKMPKLDFFYSLVMILNHRLKQMKIPLALLFLALIALFYSDVVEATKCGGYSAFLATAKRARDIPQMRVVRARVVPSDRYMHAPNRTSDPRLFDFEVVAFLDHKNGGKVGARFLGTGVLAYHLNLPPAGSSEPLAIGSEWLLVVSLAGERLRPHQCGAILEVREGTVYGFIQSGMHNTQDAPVAREPRAMANTAQAMDLSTLWGLLSELGGSDATQ